SAAEPGNETRFSVGIFDVPSDGTEAGDEPGPVAKQDEDEDRSEEPERALDEMPADDALEEVRETLDQPFPEVLGAFGNARHVSRGELRENDQRDGDSPGDNHGVGDGKAKRAGDLDGGLWQAV